MGDRCDREEEMGVVGVRGRGWLSRLACTELVDDDGSGTDAFDSWRSLFGPLRELPELLPLLVVECAPEL